MRITPDGTVSYSQRLTLSATCPMNLVKFPLDSQTCQLVIGSFAYTAEDVIYKWDTRFLETYITLICIDFFKGGRRNPFQSAKMLLWPSFTLLMPAPEKILAILDEETGKSLQVTLC